MKAQQFAFGGRDNMRIIDSLHNRSRTSNFPQRCVFLPHVYTSNFSNGVVNVVIPLGPAKRNYISQEDTVTPHYIVGNHGLSVQNRRRQMRIPLSFRVHGMQKLNVSLATKCNLGIQDFGILVKKFVQAVVLDK